MVCFGTLARMLVGLSDVSYSLQWKGALWRRPGLQNFHLLIAQS